MKRVLTLLAIMVLPLSVMAMTPVSDQALSDVTGQAGVSIIPDVTITMSETDIAWGDPDGLGGTTSAGWIGMANLDMSTDIECTIVTAPDQVLPITIDVATDMDGSYYDIGTTFIRTNLGSLKITLNALSTHIGLGASAAAATADVPAQSLGIVSMGGTDIQFDGTSYMDIYATSGDCGVNIFQDINNLELAIGYVSYGDDDGFGTTYTDAGYVGIADLSLGSIDMSGTVRIDVGTSTDDVTAVCIGLNTLTTSAGPITGFVVLGDAADFSGTKGILGEIYISEISQTVDGSVLIFAH